MNARTRILNTLRGEPVDGVPWSIYPGHVPTGEMERAFRNRGLGFTCVVPLCKRQTPNVEVIERQVWDQGESYIYRTFRTPVGEVTEKLRHDPGYGSRWTVEHLIRRPEDYQVVEFIVRDTRLIPNHQAVVAREQELGGDGLVMGSA